jgi:hypothetical protein
VLIPKSDDKCVRVITQKQRRAFTEFELTGNGFKIAIKYGYIPVVINPVLQGQQFAQQMSRDPEFLKRVSRPDMVIDLTTINIQQQIHRYFS